MEKKNLLVRIFVPVVVAGMVFVGLPACFQDDGYPEGFVLNDEAGVATMAKRSMPQGGESIKPIEPEKPSYKYGKATVTFKCTNALPSEYIDGYTVLTMTVHYSYKMENGEPTSVEYVYSAEDNPEFSIDDIDLVENPDTGYYTLVCSGTYSFIDSNGYLYTWGYSGESESDISL